MHYTKLSGGFSFFNHPRISFEWNWNCVFRGRNNGQKIRRWRGGCAPETMGRCEKRRVGRVLVTRKRGRKRFEDCDSIENSLRSVDPWGRIGWRQWKESFSLMTKPKWLPLIWPTPFYPAFLPATSSPQSSPYRPTSFPLSLSLSFSFHLSHFSYTRHTVFIG